MGRFQKLSQDSNKVIMTLIKNQNLCKLLFYDDSNPLNHPDITNTTSLINTKIFTMPKIPTQNETGSMIIMFLDNFKLIRNNPYFKSSKIVMDILVHNSLYLLPGQIRPYLILNEIDETFNNKDGIAGIGKLQFNECYKIWINDSFSGYRISYDVVDFNY